MKTTLSESEAEAEALWLIYPYASSSGSDSDGIVSGVGKIETFWFFRLRLRQAYDSTYDSDFWFSLGHKGSYDSAYDSDSDSVASENQS